MVNVMQKELIYCSFVDRFLLMTIVWPFLFVFSVVLQQWMHFFCVHLLFLQLPSDPLLTAPETTTITADHRMSISGSLEVLVVLFHCCSCTSREMHVERDWLQSE